MCANSAWPPSRSCVITEKDIAGEKDYLQNMGWGVSKMFLPIGYGNEWILIKWYWSGSGLSQNSTTLVPSTPALSTSATEHAIWCISGSPGFLAHLKSSLTGHQPSLTGHLLTNLVPSAMDLGTSARPQPHPPQAWFSHRWSVAITFSCQPQKRVGNLGLRCYPAHYKDSRPHMVGYLVYTGTSTFKEKKTSWCLHYC